MVDYSVIVPAYNEAELLPNTLKQLAASMRLISSHSGELIVVDNNSSDDTQIIAAGFGARVVFE
jgi:glycosyltransferase involved in cell wall biosynthesis